VLPVIKAYPRARISRHSSLNGWVIDLIQREGVKPKRVAATYSTIPWADRAARIKLGIKLPATPQPRPVPVQPRAITPTSTRLAKDDAGKCDPCGRQMRRPGTKTADHPGTVLRQREGLCQSCNRKDKHE
jgi:hypothetical protein